MKKVVLGVLLLMLCICSVQAQDFLRNRFPRTRPVPVNKIYKERLGDYIVVVYRIGCVELPETICAQVTQGCQSDRQGFKLELNPAIPNVLTYTPEVIEEVIEKPQPLNEVALPENPQLDVLEDETQPEPVSTEVPAIPTNIKPVN